jgi:hypothetical protein
MVNAIPTSFVSVPTITKTRVGMKLMKPGGSQEKYPGFYGKDTGSSLKIEGLSSKNFFLKSIMKIVSCKNSCSYAQWEK